MLPTYHRTATIDGQQVFYREAGPADVPVVLLLHGFPSSSHMFRHLIPALADRYHVIATDHIGYGQSSMPTVDEFDYTFDNLTKITAGLLNELGIRQFSIYVHDYGAPIGWRLALSPAYDVTAIISQSGNAYMEGFAKPFWDDLFAYASAPGPDTEPGARAKFSAKTTRWQYENGADDTTLVSPVRLGARARYRAWRPGQVQRQDHALAVRERSGRHDPGQPRQLAARPDPAEPTRQRRSSAGALPGLPEQHRRLPAAPGVLPHQPGSAARGLG
ncbi:alpha/beta fold hydrolase [Streptomyces sp. NBC_01764]|uniref:alpha/beta fold hydrolase n=1 Tax=Streptomyces sp. NBC_01764 TaxID=2975935 RepID=UPI00225AAEC9|nr:alpha/beta fold hydrolase [Streptomyces sp. NBC_01764]MCX4403780.1 alpha/beta fold hydrolase [Streptomyces sp. NBC_01764]